MNKANLLSLHFILLAFFLRSQDVSENAASARQIYFTENKGQVSDQFYQPRPDILFSGNSGDLVFYLKNNGISYQLSRVDEWATRGEWMGRKDHAQRVPAKSTVYRIDISWLNTNPAPEIKKGEARQGYENYYLESCPSGALGIKSYSDVLYKNLYPGIDLKWYEKNGSLEYDYYVAAHADHTKIRLEYKGAEAIYVDRSGMLIIKTPLGIIKEQRPLVMQNNKRLPAGWIVKNNIVSFDIKNVDPSLPLIIDPAVRLWATYYGGTAQDDSFYVYANAAGDVFLSGTTLSTGNIATTGAHQTVLGDATGDAYVAKFSAAGVRLWATYYGGFDQELGAESIEDANGNVFLTGLTQSSGSGAIATPGAHQTLYSSASSNTGDAFLVMFNSAGVRQWGTYYGGDEAEAGNGLSLDNTGNIFITGAAQSTYNISTPGSHQATKAGVGFDAFLAKFNSAGVLQWGTYYGGTSQWDISSDCVTNASGDTYIWGITSSTASIATPGSHQPIFGGGMVTAGDAFLAKFNSAGVVQWATYYGGTGSEATNKICLDAFGNLYGTGWTSSPTSTGIATPGCHQPAFGGGNDAFLVSFDASGVRQWGTYYGGAGNDFGGGVSIDASGDLYLSGDVSTNSGTTIATTCSYRPQYAGGSSDGFLAKFRSTGQRIWGTYYGSIFSDYCYACCADGQGNIYVSGFTFANSGSVIGSPNGHQPVGGGGTDAFLVKFDACTAGNAVDLTPPANLVVCPGNTTTLIATCGNWYSSATGTTILSTGPTFTTGVLTSDSTFYVEDFGCGSVSGARTPITVTLAPAPAISLTNSNPAACVGESVTLTASGAATYSWSNNPATAPTVTSNIDLIVFLNASYTVSSVDMYGCKATATIAVIPNLCIGIEEYAAYPGIVIYPNPSSASFNIQSASDLTLSLTNELGQRIRDLSLNASNNHIITVEGLPNGIYFLKGTEDNAVLNKKIIVIQ